MDPPGIFQLTSGVGRHQAGACTWTLMAAAAKRRMHAERMYRMGAPLQFIAALWVHTFGSALPYFALHFYLSSACIAHTDRCRWLITKSSQSTLIASNSSRGSCCAS